MGLFKKRRKQTIEKLPVFYSPLVLKHITGPGHPEKPERLQAIVKALQEAPFADRLQWREPRAAKKKELQLVHTKEYIETVAQMAERGGGHLDADTPVSSATFLAASLSAGAWLEAAEVTLQNHQPTLVLTRPPGHHAERDQGQGFCIFSNAAIAARYAVHNLGIEKVAVVDWDVHHGNGTQHALEKSRRFAYLSLHQFPHYPGTGADTERGAHNNVRNIPLPAGAGRKQYHTAFKRIIIPFLENFGPDLILVSAGFDAHRDDPLADINLEADDYHYFTRKLFDYSPNLVIGLEGGYNLKALAESIVAVVKALLK